MRHVLGLGLAALVWGCVGDSPATPPTTGNDGGADAPVGAANTLYVDPVKGDDTRPGNVADAPLKTIKQAVKLAKAGYTINLASGIYDAGSGEDWLAKDGVSPGYEPADDVTITTAQKGGATLVGVSPKSVLRLVGGKLVNVKITGFANGVTAVTKPVEIVGVEFQKVPWAVFAGLDAKVTITGASFTDVDFQGPELAAQQNAVVNVYQSTFVNNKVSSIISTLDTAQVTVDGSDFHGNPGQVAQVAGTSKLGFTMTKIQNNTAAYPVLYVGDKAELTLGVNTTVTDNSQGVWLSAGTTGAPKLFLDSAKLERNGDIGIDVEGGATVKGKYSTVADHKLVNVRARKFSNSGEPSVDLSLGNTLKMSAPNGYSIDVSCTACSGTLLLGAIAWVPSSPAPTGLINVGGSEVALAPHYRLNGSGYKAQF